MDFTQIDLFQSLTANELNEVIKIARPQQYGRSDIIFPEGAFERNIYIIETGQVEIFKKNPVQGEQSLAILKNGDYFGEMAFFEKTASRSASARALQASNLIMIEGSEFEKLLYSHPSISIKLLAKLSARLRETNKMVTATGKTTLTSNSRVITIASAKDGYGKSTFAAVLAKMIANELGKKVLFIDLDLYFAGATQIFGLHSPRSIIDINKKIQLDESRFEIMNEVVKTNDNIFVVPAPRSFQEAEQIHANDVARVVKYARRSFDYVIIDTGSTFDENLFTALDTADIVFFILNFSNLSTITDNVRFFQGITKLGYPREKLILLANFINSEFSTSKTSKVFPFPIIGGLPRLQDPEPQYGKTAYENNPKGPYCEMLRMLLRQVLKETNLQISANKSNIFNMIFGDKDPEQAIGLQLDELHHKTENPFMPVISSKDVRSQVKYIRYSMMFGYLDEAKDHLLQFMEHSTSCAPLLSLYGEIMLFQEENSQAIEAFQKAVSIDEAQHLAQGYLAALTGSQEKLEKAIKTVSEKIKENPTHLDLLNDLGKIYLKNGKFPEAKEQFDKALKENPNYMDAKVNLAITMAHLNQADHAIEMLLGIENKSPRIFFTLGEIFYQTGRLYLSFKSYSKASRLYPTYPRMAQKLSELNHYLRKLESLIDLHERFVNTNPDFPDLHAKLGNFYHLAGKSELAIDEFKKSLKLNPDYQYASLKLDALQKDMIWRISKTHLEDQLPEYKAVTRDLTVNVHCECKKLKKGVFPDDAVMQIKNVRTGKVMQKAINAHQIEAGFARIDCAPLGLVACQDILLFQVLDIKSKRVLRFEPHYLELDEIMAKACDINLTIDLTEDLSESRILPKYFLVHLDSRQFAEIISSENSLYKAFLRNKNNGLESIGHINPENEDQINFVLNGASSENGFAAVAPGDRLAIKIEDENKSEVFSMEFAVGNSDISNFCKTIVPQEIN